MAVICPNLSDCNPWAQYLPISSDRGAVCGGAGGGRGGGFIASGNNKLANTFLLSMPASTHYLTVLVCRDCTDLLLFGYLFFCVYLNYEGIFGCLKTI